MESVKLTAKHICYALIFTFFQFGCSRHVCKFGAQKEIDSMDNELDNININDRNQDKPTTPSKKKDPCFICFKEWLYDDDCVKLKCRSGVTHYVHRSCINQWAKNAKSIICPACRRYDISENVLYDLVKDPELELLFKAIKAGDLECFRSYVQKNPSILDEMYYFKPIHSDRVYATPLYYAAYCNSIAIVRELLKYKHIDVTKKSRNEGTPLHAAAEEGHIGICKILLDPSLGIDVNNEDTGGFTALELASMRGHTGIVSILLNISGIDDPDKQKPYGQSALRSATTFGHKAIVELFSEVDGFNINQEDQYGKTPLFWVARKCNISMAKMLIVNYNANVNKQDENGDTPLHWATMNGLANMEEMANMVILLQKYGASVNAKNKDGKTALDLARDKGHSKCATVLENLIGII